MFLMILGWVCTVLAVAGVILNNRKLRACFFLWLISNGISCAIHCHAGIWPLAGRDIIFVVLAIEGLWLWKNPTH